MANTSNRAIIISCTGDTPLEYTRSAAANATAPAQTDIITQTGAGSQTITPPTGGTTPTGVTLTPPAGNTQTITLKGIVGDTGVVLHKTDPTSIGLNSPTATFVLTFSGTVTGLRLDWT